MTATVRMQSLIKAWEHCVECPIGTFAKHHVFFRGALEKTKIVFIGEGPGREEDRVGEPFVGKSGHLFDAALREARVTPNLYAFTNLVCCRPADGEKRPNRPPNNEEIINCAPRLYAMLQIFKPKTIALLGKVPSRAWNESRPLAGVNVFHLHHPAYLLRLGGKDTDAYRETVALLVRIRKGVLSK